LANQLDVAREALAQIGTRSKIEALDDGSPEATYINLLYAPLRDFLLAQGDYDFSLVNEPATAVAGATLPWYFAYSYPVEAVRIRQLTPIDFDPWDVRPLTWNVNSTDGVRKILTQVAIHEVAFTKAVAEALWDPLFRQSFVRFLSSALAFALENRIEASKVKMEEAMQFAGLGNLRDT
jgi:hypothetical protein